DQYVVYGFVLQERFKRPQPQKFVEDVGDKVATFRLVERMFLERELLMDDFADLGLDLRAGHRLQRLEVHQFQQPPVKGDLEVEIAGRETAGALNILCLKLVL